MDAFGLILVRSGNDLNDLVAGKLEVGNFHRGTVHEIGVEDAEDGFVRDNEQVVLFALELEDDWLQTYG